MAFTMPTFASRLLRPFTQSTRMGLSSDGATGSVVNVPEGAEKAILAAGCFWGVEHIFRKYFTGKGLIDARVGYVGGDRANPSYNQVCSGSTGRKLSSFTNGAKAQTANCDFREQMQKPLF
jgi:peptide-methionine (S)-S-oxide reductase